MPQGGGRISVTGGSAEEDRQTSVWNVWTVDWFYLEAEEWDGRWIQVPSSSIFVWFWEMLIHTWILYCQISKVNGIFQNKILHVLLSWKNLFSFKLHNYFSFCIFFADTAVFFKTQNSCYLQWAILKVKNNALITALTVTLYLGSVWTNFWRAANTSFMLF